MRRKRYEARHREMMNWKRIFASRLTGCTFEKLFCHQIITHCHRVSADSTSLTKQTTLSRIQTALSVHRNCAFLSMEDRCLLKQIASIGKDKKRIEKILKKEYRNPKAQLDERKNESVRILFH